MLFSFAVLPVFSSSWIFKRTVFLFPTTVGGVSGCGCGSRSCSCGRWRSTASTNTGRQRDQPRRRSGGRYVGTCHLRRDDTCNSDTGYRPQRSTKTPARQQHTFPLSRSWSQSNVWGKYDFFLFACLYRHPSLSGRFACRSFDCDIREIFYVQAFCKIFSFFTKKL